MRVSREGNKIILTRVEGEKRVSDESNLYYRLRNYLRNKGEDVIKKEMSKDGHLVSDGVYYVRSRRPGRPGSYYIYDPRYALRDAAQEFNEGKVELQITPAEQGASGESVQPRLRDVLDWLPSD